MKVRKKSGKPFKSGLKINTVTKVVKHSITERYSYTFEEDNSIVEVRVCEEVIDDTFNCP